MQGRILICIGCNSHDADNVSDLSSAEADAENVYSALMDPAIGDYEEARSALLLSPTLHEVRSQLATIARSQSAISTLTFYFAGHGEIHHGSLYLYTEDSELDALSVSALSLSDLMRIIADQQIPHANIILDACQAGGLLSELSPLLNAEAIGARHTPSVSLLAMAASNEGAGEDDDGGFGTQTLMSCIKGERVCNSEFPTLDLMEIGREVSRAFNGAEQMPVYWGLNLTGTSTLCYNPFFTRASKNVEDLTPYAGLADTAYVSSPFRTEIWTTYLNLPNSWDPRNFYELLDRALDTIEADENTQANFVESLALSFSEQAKANSDKVVASEVLAVGGMVLLKRSAPNSDAEATCLRLFRQSLDWAYTQISALAEELRTDRFALLSRSGGGFDFYYLPIRISKILGWANAILLSSGEEKGDAAQTLLQTLLEHIGQHYAMNLIVMSELQAGPIALIGAALSQSDDSDRLETILSYYLNSLSQQAGLIGSNTLASEKTFEYLARRYQGLIEPGSEFVSQPSELIAVCLRLSSLADLSDVMDEMMSDLDHIWLNAFLPGHYRNIGDDALENGTNITMRIGHDIWRVAEFEAAWPTEAVSVPQTQSERLAANLASLVFTDRVSWFELRTNETN